MALTRDVVLELDRTALVIMPVVFASVLLVEELVINETSEGRFSMIAKL